MNTNFLSVCVLTALALPASAGAQRRDVLTSVEADKVREAGETPGLRIKLFVGFAEDRMKKFNYELANPSPAPGPSARRGERLRALMDAYTACVDDAAELVKLGMQKQQDLAKAAREIQPRLRDFLGWLERLANSGAERELYAESLEDATDGTREAMHTVEKALKEMAPPPVRRRQ